MSYMSKREEPLFMPDRNEHAHRSQWIGQPQDMTAFMNLMHEGQRQQMSMYNAMQLPVVELEKFDGNVMHFWRFIKRFEVSVENYTEDEAAKYTRLLQLCTGRAKAVVESCHYMDPHIAFRRAKHLLTERFGAFRALKFRSQKDCRNNLTHLFGVLKL